MVHKQEKLTALILVGGYGKRLRPLTYTIPKPLIPFINKPILEHQIEALVQNGVKTIVLALNYYSDIIIKEIKNYKTKYNIEIIYSKENEVLGTGGPLALARNHLKNNFFVLNSDVICNYPMKKMMEFHLKHKKEGTILVTTVQDPSRFGLVKTFEDSDCVQEFVEKPQNSFLNLINAGIYIFNESIFSKLEVRECSLEREIFPQIVKEQSLMVYKLQGFWMDIGQIKDYLKGQKMFLDDKNKEINKYANEIVTKKILFIDQCVTMEEKKTTLENGIIGKNTIIENDAIIGENVVIGNNVKIGNNTIIQNSSIFDNVYIGNNVIIKDSIIGWNCIIKNNVRIVNFSVLGEISVINENNVLDNVLVEPNKIM